MSVPLATSGVICHDSIGQASYGLLCPALPGDFDGVEFYTPRGIDFHHRAQFVADKAHFEFCPDEVVLGDIVSPFTGAADHDPFLADFTRTGFAGVFDVDAFSPNSITGFSTEDLQLLRARWLVLTTFEY